MNRQNLILLTVTAALMAGGAMTLHYFRNHQKLGIPAVKTYPIAGSQNLEIVLPEKVLNYDSIPIEVSAVETNTLPRDTSFGKRSYRAPDGFRLDLSVVLMGGDRTSLHKPQFCLQGQGWCVDVPATVLTNIHIAQPCSYDLPVVGLVSSREVNVNGENSQIRGIYVYYYVANGSLYAGTTGFGHMRRTAIDVLTTGSLPRWAYVSYFAWCRPGQEEATLERMKEFISVATPQFQIYPAAATALTARN